MDLVSKWIHSHQEDSDGNGYDNQLIKHMQKRG